MLLRTNSWATAIQLKTPVKSNLSPRASDNGFGFLKLLQHFICNNSKTMR